jgi:putative tricarboxylic transport membrane protein
MSLSGGWARCIFAALLFVAPAVTALSYVAPDVSGEMFDRGGIAPTTWPRIMLSGIALCGLILLARELKQRIASDRASDTHVVAEAPQFSNRLAALGIILLIAYGIAIPVAGFAFATCAFLCVWLWAGGVRKIATVLLVSVIGTTVLLYVFVKVSHLPLDRGIGIFDNATIAVYRVLGIY